MEQMHVEPIRFKDVRGNELLYIKIKKGEKEVLINVGNRTFKNVEELINPKQQELPLTNVNKEDEAGLEQIINEGLEKKANRIENGKPVQTPQTQEQLKEKVQSVQR